MQLQSTPPHRERRSELARLASCWPPISYDGRHVAFDSAAENLGLSSAIGASLDENATDDIFVTESQIRSATGPDTVLLDGFEG